MRKYFAISLLLVYLFSTTELNQVLKFPLLVDHYFDHKEEMPELTLFQFFHMHYTNPHPKDDKHEKDMQLPFKSHSDCSSALSGTFVPGAFFGLGWPEPESGLKQAMYKNLFLTNARLSEIWQPPRWV